MIYGIDASNHQGNMGDLRGYSASFFIHKLTEGTTYIDPNASHNLSMARKLGVPVLGGYHYLRAGKGVGQADYFADRARQLFGHDLSGHLWQLDCEADATWADVKAFKHRWDLGTDAAPLLFYSGDWWLKPRGWNVASLKFAGLWAAPNNGYVGGSDNVRPGDWKAGYGGYDRLTICQYDARQSIGDTNLFDGTVTQLRDLIRGDALPNVHEVWASDIIPAPDQWGGDAKHNPKWRPESFLRENYDQGHKALDKLDKMAAQIEAQGKQIEALTKTVQALSGQKSE